VVSGGLCLTSWRSQFFDQFGILSGASQIMDLFFFDPRHLRSLAEANAEKYQNAEPFPHIVIDDFLPDPVLRSVIDGFPGPDELAWHKFEAEREVKLATDDPTTIPPYLQHVLSQFNGKAMVEFLEVLTGIEGLIPDPHYVGGGLHQIERGGRLKVHSDFNRHNRLKLDRRLNLILYLNEDWQEDFGGHLELWDRDMAVCRERVLPVANRCVVFSTTDYSYHGHPDPLTCPPDRSRRSMALYYYTNGRPASEVSAARTTRFRARPGEATGLSAAERGRDLLTQVTPPVLLESARRLKHRATKG
jgi:hypothetical protein